jgi:hypothetical protein
LLLIVVIVTLNHSFSNFLFNNNITNTTLHANTVVIYTVTVFKFNPKERPPQTTIAMVLKFYSAQRNTYTCLIVQCDAVV